ncbi:MAG TPA: galactokinase [Candidatus Limnocylindrales bacterium]|nr:galactokinase [Candidatus Limnocylindrales bacterium]
MSDLLQRALAAFSIRFDGAPTLAVRAPGRVNLIGEHTDYNDGFVLPMAIDREVVIVLRPRLDPYVVVYSLDFDEMIQFSPAEMEDRREGGLWVEYMEGVAWALQEAGFRLKGWEGVVGGDVPIGAGLSSSAAMELATARAFASISGLPWDPAQMALLGQRAENEWVGVKTGIMDQMISAAGVEGRALLIDCRSLETDAVPLPPGTLVVILDTSTRRELVTSAYNERRAQCEAAAAYFGVKALRDVSLARFEAEQAGLDEVVRRRARHIITENARTVQAAEAMRQGDAAQLGHLMDASHVSLRDDFEITNDALNTMASIAQAHPASYGARMTGGGFGGCAVALVRADQVEAFVADITHDYHAATGLTPAVYVTPAAAGASVLALD